MSEFNDQVIAEFRANRGRVVRAAGFGSSLVLLHATGARMGTDRDPEIENLHRRRTRPRVFNGGAITIAWP